MMKSWLSFLLPKDEYREKMTLYFLSEGSIVLLFYLLTVFIMNKFVPGIQIDWEFSLFIGIWIFIGYVLLRYITSGLEYTDIITETDYKRQRKVLLVKSSGFVLTFILLYPVFSLPANAGEWLSLIALSVLAGILLFFMDYLSLKKSYEKNKV